MVTYEATGAHNGDLPETVAIDGKAVPIGSILKDSTIVLSMAEYSATAPLVWFAKKYKNLRGASMPGVAKFMEESGLAADYGKVAQTCARLAPFFEKAIGVEVVFSTGHFCYFDLSDNRPVFQDNGKLDPDAEQGEDRLLNLPSGEVCTVPNENKNSQTIGEIPTVIGHETIVFVVKNNQIIDIKGDGPLAEKNRMEFRAEPAQCNIAEVAIGCNDRARVTGNALEDEKAGFHWAYGRSDHLGGRIGIKDFSSAEKVIHMDIVYAKGNPIVCQKFDFVFPDNSRKTAIIDGELKI
jgi:leucyl aminopeptidase (aminopeptidase T)